MQSRYTNALIKELQLYRPQNIKTDTIFIGGGTPSLLRQHLITEILKAAEAAFSVSKDSEITMEANPGTLTRDKLYTCRKAGINRLSIGAQSMDDRLLKIMGRIHTAEDFKRTYQAARTAGFQNINVDLMFGIPGQTQDIWRKTLQEVLEMEPEHISFYSLQLEEGTDFFRRYKNDQMDLPPEQEEREMYHEGIRLLKEAGYVHYEISNCARPGFQCRHNLKYWNFDEYAAAGLGAHSFSYEKGRQCNTSSLDTYIRRLEAGELPTDRQAYEQETLQDYMGEYAFTALRKREGLDTEDFYRTFGADFYRVYADRLRDLQAYEQKGLLILKKDRLFLTEKGIDCSNEIMAEFV